MTTTTPTSARRLIRFRLGTLVLFTLVCGLAFGGFRYWRGAEAQREFIERIHLSGVDAFYPCDLDEAGLPFQSRIVETFDDGTASSERVISSAIPERLLYQLGFDFFYSPVLFCYQSQDDFERFDPIIKGSWPESKAMLWEDVYLTWSSNIK